MNVHRQNFVTPGAPCIQFACPLAKTGTGPLYTAASSDLIAPAIKMPLAQKSTTRHRIFQGFSQQFNAHSAGLSGPARGLHNTYHGRPHACPAAVDYFQQRQQGHTSRSLCTPPCPTTIGDFVSGTGMSIHRSNLQLPVQGQQSRRWQL